MGRSKVELGNEVLIDLTFDTVTPEVLLKGYTAHNAAGDKITGEKELRHKVFNVTSPTAVAAKDVTVVSGDPDVAAHYADALAMCVVRKVSNNNTNGTFLIVGQNHSFEGRYGMYAGFNAASDTTSFSTNNFPLATDSFADGVVNVRCNSNGDIIVHANRMQTNFGGADYVIDFTW